MRAVYTRKVDGGLSLINGAPKSDIERDLSMASDAKIQSEKDTGRLPVDIVRDPETGLFSLTDDQYHRMILAHAVQHETDRVTVLADDVVLPSDEFFDAWTHDGKDFGHNLDKVKAIALDRLRNIRNPLLTKYDGLQSRANDLGDMQTLADIKAKKDALRGATDKLKALTPTSVDDVKAAVPDLSGY